MTKEDETPINLIWGKPFEGQVITVEGVKQAEKNYADMYNEGVKNGSITMSNIDIYSGNRFFPKK